MPGEGSPQPVVGCPSALPRTALDDGSNGDVDRGGAAGHGCLCQGGVMAQGGDGGHVGDLKNMIYLRVCLNHMIL